MQTVETWAAVTEEAARVFAERLGEDAPLTLQAKLALLNVMGIREDPNLLAFVQDLLFRIERVFGRRLHSGGEGSPRGT